MKKKLIVFISVLVLSFTLSACGSQIELSDENSELIAQYAAGILLKYDKNYTEGLSDILSLEDDSTELENTDITDELAQTEDIETTDETLQSLKTSQSNNTEILELARELENIDVSERDTDIQSAKSLNEGLNIDGFDFTYTSHEFAEYYPNNGTYENMDYIVNPRDGNQLLVLKFNIKNTDSETKELDLLSLNPEFYAVLNNVTRSKAIKTVLLNDLSTLSVDIEPGNTLEAVLLYEVSLDFNNDISSINLEVNMNRVTTNVVLK